MSAMAAGGSSSIKTATIVAASVGFVIAMVQTFGYWLLTGPDPGTAVDKDDKWRVIARYTLLTTALSAPFQAMWGSRGGMGGMKALASSAAVPPWVTALAAVSLVLMGVQLVGYFSIATHLRRLALRVPNRRLAGQTRVVMWGFIATQLMSIAMMAIIVLMVKQIGANPSNVAPPIFITYGAVSCSYGLGMLVFGIWAIVLMFGHRRAFSIAATQARSTWARDPLAATPFRVGAIAPPTQDVPPAGATM